MKKQRDELQAENEFLRNELDKARDAPALKVSDAELAYWEFESSREGELSWEPVADEFVARVIALRPGHGTGRIRAVYKRFSEPITVGPDDWAENPIRWDEP